MRRQGWTLGGAAVTLKTYSKAPFPYFGGKTDAATATWAALGDPDHYAEPFAGSLATLLLRPAPCNRTYRSETVNDMDGLLCNAWRAIQISPDATAEAASWPVCEADLHARHLAILKWKREHELERLMGDPKWHDPEIAGWWLWGICSWIGSGWCSGQGPWIVGDDGRIAKRPRAVKGEGVSRQLPHVSNNGMGVNHAALREGGVADEHEFHPLTMPELRRWFAFLSARLRHVRILNGDWKRLCKDGALKYLPVRNGGICGVFLDPPYRTTGTRDADLYSHDDGDRISAEVREWCAAKGDEPWLRIVLAGFAGEGHEALEALGWRCVPWFGGGWLKGGYANQDEEEGTAQGNERLWLSPGCLRRDAVQNSGPMFAGLA